MNRKEIYNLINDERDRQDSKWGCLPRTLSDVVWLAILTEEVGEVAKAILQRDWNNLKREIVQVAAVAIAYLEDNENHNNTTYKAG